MAAEPVEYMKNNSKTQVVEALKEVIANAYALYFKTHSYHWNVEGPMFQACHEMFETQYTEMWEALDDLAERLRALGEYAAFNTEDILKGATIKSATGVPSAQDMCEDLADSNTNMAKILLNAIETCDDAGDEVTLDMFVERANTHEKYGWMLRSMAK